jgi:hypothetical protein
MPRQLFDLRAHLVDDRVLLVRRPLLPLLLVPDLLHLQHHQVDQLLLLLQRLGLLRGLILRILQLSLQRV